MQVVVENVSFAFRNRQVLECFSAVFDENAVTALVGPSGSGKSTLLAAIAGYTHPKHGHIWFVDRNGERSSPSVGQVSWIAQDANVLGARTALDNVLIGPLSDGFSFGESLSRANDAIADVKLTHLSHSRARSMSGGEKQRIVIARSLASDRALIIADEPSAGLDEANTRSLAQLFAHVQGRATVIVATHDPVMMEAANNVVNLRSSA